MYQQSNIIIDRLVRILIFVVLNFIIIRFLLGLNLSNIDQIKIVLASTLCFMFVLMYYPIVILNQQ